MCIFILLYWSALRRREALELNAMEVFATRVSIGAAALNGGVALTSLAIVWLAPIQYVGLSGMIYPILLAPGFTVYYLIVGRKEGTGQNRGSG